MKDTRVIISTLRRSGSTIFWRCFRDASNALTLDEPFNPNLGQLPQKHHKGVYNEYLDILEKYSGNFWDKFSPIYTLEELDTHFRTEHINWLQWLFDQNEYIVLDTTRCWRKIEHIAEAFETNIYLIHLHRSPAGFVTSHLLPSELESSIGGQWKLFKRRRAFFNIDSGFNYWNLEKLTGYGPHSAYSTKILTGSIPQETFYSWKAHVRLLHFWKTAHEMMESVGNRVFNNRFLSVSYDRFSREPEEVFQEIQNLTGLSIELGQLPSIHAASPAFREGDARWYEAAEKVGIEASPQTLFRSE